MKTEMKKYMALGEVLKQLYNDPTVDKTELSDIVLLMQEIRNGLNSEEFFKTYG